jgi:hypothetical protein
MQRQGHSKIKGGGGFVVVVLVRSMEKYTRHQEH